MNINKLWPNIYLFSHSEAVKDNAMALSFLGSLSSFGEGLLSAEDREGGRGASRGGRKLLSVEEAL